MINLGLYDAVFHDAFTKHKDVKGCLYHRLGAVQHYITIAMTLSLSTKDIPVKSTAIK